MTGATECALNILGDKEAGWEAIAPLGGELWARMFLDKQGAVDHHT